MRWLLAVVALAGCDKVFGLDSITPHPDAPSDGVIDAPPLMITGTLIQRYATNNAAFAPEVDTRVLPPGTFGLAARLDDGSDAPVTYNPDGSFWFMLNSPGQRYQLVSTAFGTIESKVPHLAIASRVAGRPDRHALTDAFLQFTFPAVTAGLSDAFVVSTGQYSNSYTALGAGTATSYTWNWSGAVPSGGVPLGLLDGTRYDEVFVLQYETDYALPPGPPYTAIHAVSAAVISQEPGYAAAVPTPAPPNPTFNACVQFSDEQGTEYTRLSQAELARTYTPYWAWNLLWVPNAEQLGTVAAVSLAASAAYQVPQNSIVTPPFQQPFPGGDLVANVVVASFFNVTAPGATSPGTLGNFSQRLQTITPTSSCATPPVRVDLPGHAAIADIPTLDGARLDAVNQTVPVTRGEVVASLSGTGVVHDISVSLFELVAINSHSYVEQVATITTTDMTVHFDPTSFQHGHTYVVETTVRMNVPNAPTGDFSTLALPFENVQTWSQPFVVQ